MAVSVGSARVFQGILLEVMTIRRRPSWRPEEISDPGSRNRQHKGSVRQELACVEVGEQKDSGVAGAQQALGRKWSLRGKWGVWGGLISRGAEGRRLLYKKMKSSAFAWESDLDQTQHLICVTRSNSGKHPISSRGRGLSYLSSLKSGVWGAH